MKKLAAVILIVSATSLTGCATILSGSSKIINVTTSNGEEIKVSVTGDRTAQTFTAPSTITVQKGGNLIFTPESNKCASQVVQKKIEGTFWVNILTGGLFGSSTDFSSGSVWSYDNNVILSCKS